MTVPSASMQADDRRASRITVLHVVELESIDRDELVYAAQISDRPSHSPSRCTGTAEWADTSHLTTDTYPPML